MSTANHALHATVLVDGAWPRRSGCSRFRRFWRRARLLGIVKNVDKLC